jgi:hypothetical protein
MSSEGSHKLNYALKNLRRLWEEIGPLWRDEVRDDFEQHYILPITNQVNAAVRGMNEVHDIAHRAKRECS